MKRLIHLPFILATCSLCAQSNNALDFDAVDDRVDCGTDASLDITGTHITVEAWIKPAAWGANFWSGNIVNKEDAAWAGYMLRCGAGGKLNFSIGDGITWHETTTTTNVLTLDAWQHVAGTYDGSFVRLYVNGVEVYNAATTISIASAIHPVALGDWSVNQNHRYYAGQMDEVRIWNITLDAATIAAQMNRSFCTAQAGLVAYYKCDQGIADGDNTSITTLTDETGANNGALSGFGLTGSTSNFIGGAPLGTPVSGAICPDEGYAFNGQTLTQPGVYTATFTNSNGCDSVVVLTLVQTSVNTNVAQNQNLLISQASSSVYQWINCATNQPISGATGQFYTAFTVGQYAVIVTQNGCTDTSACYPVTTIGIEERQLPTARIWPTVTTDQLNIELSSPMDRADIRVVDMTGRTVLRRSIPVLLKTTIDVTALVQGAYVIEVGNADGARALRFVRE